MYRIDADAHVDETEATWEYLEGADRRFVPSCEKDPNGRDERWVFDGMHLRRPIRNYQRTGATEATSRLLDIDARLAHMDALQIDLQVLFPTAWIRSNFVGHEEAEIALTRSYNRWIADRTALSNGRLRWAAVLPMLSMDEAVKELQWAKEHGAVGVFKKGVECQGRNAADEYFYPLYESAADLDLAMCIHTGSEGFEGIRTPAALDAVQAFAPLVTSDVFERFPKLRVGIIEAGASWIPFLLTIVAARGRSAHMQGVTLDHSLNVDLELFRRTNIYVTCQTQDDLPYLMQYGVEDNIICGTDYTHADQSAELKALDNVAARADNGEITAEVAQKILEDNPRRFYNL
jgi:predicted TIM-barrel fold metal-dependent hydrolase